jgi:outer membrane biosynthesis protein TonB
MDTSTARQTLKRLRLTTSWFALACGLIGAVACSSSKSKQEQLSALDTAKQSGAVTQQEYDAKKAEIEGTPAPPPTVAVTPAPPPPAPTPAPEPPPPTQPAPQASKQQPVAAKVGGSDKEPDPAPTSTCDDPEYKSHKAGPEERFFPMPQDRVRAAVVAALKTLDFTVHKDEGDEIEASKKRHASVVIGAGGEKETLHFAAATQGGKQGTTVSGDTKKRMPTQKSWTAAILAQTACNLK